MPKDNAHPKNPSARETSVRTSFHPVPAMMNAPVGRSAALMDAIHLPHSVTPKPVISLPQKTVAAACASNRQTSVKTLFHLVPMMMNALETWSAALMGAIHRAPHATRIAAPFSRRMIAAAASASWDASLDLPFLQRTGAIPVSARNPGTLQRRMPAPKWPAGEAHAKAVQSARTPNSVTSPTTVAASGAKQEPARPNPRVAISWEGLFSAVAMEV